MVRRAEIPDTMMHRWTREGKLGSDKLGNNFEGAECTDSERRGERSRRAGLQAEMGPSRPVELPRALSLARVFACGSATALVKAYFATVGTWKEYNAQALRDAVLSRPHDRSLITVSNHTSVVDDPVTIAMALPLMLTLTPSQCRMGICSEEICFSSRKRSTLFNMFQTKPIERGGGLEQPQLRHIADAIKEHKWLHVFPEGKTTQGDLLRTRTERSPERGGGRLKWGTAKLIVKGGNAKDIKIPIILPMYVSVFLFCFALLYFIFILLTLLFYFPIA